MGTCTQFTSGFLHGLLPIINIRRSVMGPAVRAGLVLVVVFVGITEQRPQFNFGSLLTNGLGAALNTAIGRDCKGRAQGDYFYGCQCVGPFNIGRKRRSPQNTDTRFFLNSNQGLGGGLCEVQRGNRAQQEWGQKITDKNLTKCKCKTEITVGQNYPTA